jgi:hypothetical protein
MYNKCWWLLLLSQSQKLLKLALKGDSHALLVPSNQEEFRMRNYQHGSSFWKASSVMFSLSSTKWNGVPEKSRLKFYWTIPEKIQAQEERKIRFR